MRLCGLILLVGMKCRCGKGFFSDVMVVVLLKVLVGKNLKVLSFMLMLVIILVGVMVFGRIGMVWC